MAPPRCLKFAAGGGASSVFPRPPARGSAPRGRLSLASSLGASSRHFPAGSRPRGSQIPSPVSIPPCARAPPAPSLRAGSPARRERKVNARPQPQRRITMRKINQGIAVRVPGSRRRTLLRPPRRERGTPGPPRLGPGGARSGLRGALRGQGVREGRVGAGQAGIPRARDFTLRAGHAFPRASPPALSFQPVYSPALREPPARRRPQPLCPALSQPFIRPSPPPGPGRGAPSRLLPRRTGRAARPGPRTAGTRSGRAAGKRQRGGRGSPGTPFSPTWFQLASGSGPLILRPAELLKFATCSPSRRGGNARGCRDSPPGCGHRCPARGGSRLAAARSRGSEPRRLAAGLGMGRPLRNGPSPWARRSGAVPTRGPRPLRSGSASSRGTRGRPARLRGAGLWRQSPRSN